VKKIILLILIPALAFGQQPSKSEDGLDTLNLRCSITFEILGGSKIEIENARINLWKATSSDVYTVIGYRSPEGMHVAELSFDDFEYTFSHDSKSADESNVFKHWGRLNRHTLDFIASSKSEENESVLTIQQGKCEVLGLPKI